MVIMRKILLRLLALVAMITIIASLKSFISKENNQLKTTPAKTTNSNEFSPIIKGVAIQGGSIQIKKAPVGSDKNYSYKFVGDYSVTAYTSGKESTGKTKENADYGITATGATVKEGLTVASDWNYIPPGSRIYIEGVGERVVQDAGGDIKGQKLDLYIADLKQAIQFGVQKLKVYLVKNNNEI
jgi:3D (Asp-Asp-Asp) domain-containing protein